jgi:hypothetical protein
VGWEVSESAREIGIGTWKESKQGITLRREVGKNACGLGTWSVYRIGSGMGVVESGKIHK